MTDDEQPEHLAGAEAGQGRASQDVGGPQSHTCSNSDPENGRQCREALLSPEPTVPASSFGLLRVPS